MEINQGNISTIASMIWTSIVAPLLLYLGIQIDQGIGVGIVTAILTLAFLVWSAFNPNTMKLFGNNKEEINPVTEYEDGLNEEYVTGDDDEC